MAKSFSTPRRELPQLGLRHVSDVDSGFIRQGSGGAFRYFTADHKRLKNDATLKRIKSLVIPPAWTKVWISPYANSHLQATGRDARGRKQYRYHPDFRRHRDETKFTNIVEFAQALPRIRRHARRDLNLPGLPRERVIATIVQLLERTLIRVGNQEYAEHNHSFGLSTLQNKHVRHCGAGIRFIFLGKSGVPHNVEVADRKLARIVLRCHDLPGQHLFEYQDHAGAVHAINSADVNDYIRQSSGEEFSAKNFRTWKGTVIAALAFEKMEPPTGLVATRKLVAKVIRDVASELRNTPATCRKYYVHPALITALEKTHFHPAMHAARAKAHRTPIQGLSHDETTVLNLLKHFARASK